MILGDDIKSWRPKKYQTDSWGCQLRLVFPTVKLLDYRKSIAALETASNPFAVLTAAHLHAKASDPTDSKRRESKFRLYRNLIRAGRSRPRILELLRLVDWILSLSENNSRRFREEILKYHEEDNMIPLSSWERAAREEGLEEGLKRGTQAGLQQAESAAKLQALGYTRQLALAILEKRFGSVPDDIRGAVSKICEQGRLNSLALEAATEASLDAIRALL